MTTVNMSTQLWEELQCGAIRKAMKTNCLLTKPVLGKAKKTTFMEEDPSKIFGVRNAMDTEGSREVTMMWREHVANPNAKPGPDFRAMNKLATMRGLTTASQQPEFRACNRITLKSGEHHVKKPSLTAGRDPRGVYGTPSAHRTAEQIRAAGPDEPPIKHVVQGAYQLDWVSMNMSRQDAFRTKKCTFQATPTKASMGHTLGAKVHMETWRDEPTTTKDAFKLTKFKKVPPKVTQYNGRSCSPVGAQGEELVGADETQPVHVES